MVRTRFALAVAVGALAATVAGAQERAFTLRFKDAAGQPVPFYQELKTEVKQFIKVQGQELPQSQTSTFYYAWTPLKEDAGRWTVRQKIEAVKMEIDISGNPMNYDSTKPAGDPGANPNTDLTDFFKNLVGSEFVVTLGPGYAVEKVEGKDAFIKKLGSAGAQMEALLKRVMTDDALKQMADPTANLLPAGPKKKGDRWEKASSINLGPVGSYRVLYKFTYVEPDTDPATSAFEKLALETVLVYKPPTDAGADGLLFKIKDGSKMESDPAESKGVVYYDAPRRRIARAEINMKLTGDLVVEIGGTETKVQLTQVQKTTITTRGVSFLAPAGTPEPPEPAEPPATGPGTGATASGAAGPCAPCAPPCRERRVFGRILLRPCFPGWHR
ncbi:MAG: hypothetical protein FJ304_16100 [Planctomycetes bacterium]|nr:hypothetical protein [Planctomycetota bacterium]